MEDYYQPRDNHTSEKYESILGIFIAVPEWEAITTATVLSIIILMTLVGNILVILSVFKHKPLRIAQNFFLVSLAVADLTVGVLVLPLNIINTILGQWKFGKFVCKIWLTCDILCCTASILNLCAIALDRYRAITDPLNYARKRTLKRVLAMIGGVWLLSAVISSPPLFGWNDWPAVFNESTKCELTRRQGYVVYSSLGSFYIPLFIMAIVYMEIFIATRRRLRERARASTLSAIKYNQTQKGRRPSGELDSMSSDTNVEEITPKSPQNITDRCVSLINKYVRKTSVVSQDSFTDENGDPPSSPQYVTKSPKTRRQSIKSRSQKIKDAENPKQRISLSKERRAARTLGIIMGVFVVCWLPFFLMYVIVPFCHSCEPSEKLIHFLTWLGYINSAANPVIYTIFNMDFRKAFKKLLHISI